jgi:hypothetical protein
MFGYAESSRKPHEFSKENELAHYSRIVQLKYGKFYQVGDKLDNPSGPALSVDWDSPYPIQKNPRVRDYGDSDLYETAIAFNQSYAQFLALLTKAYNGQPQLLLDALPQMFDMRQQITQLNHTRIPGKRDVNAAPTFEIENLSA